MQAEIQNRILVGTSLLILVYFCYHYVDTFVIVFALLMALCGELYAILNRIAELGEVWAWQDLVLFSILGFISFMRVISDRWTLLALIVTVSTSDICQYVFGKLSFTKVNGGPSPNKTWGGYAGSFISLLVCYLFGVNLVIGVMWIVFGMWGDLTVSLFKRSMRIKDTSNIFGHHGGLLDRMDSIFGALMAHAVLTLFI